MPLLRRRRPPVLEGLGGAGRGRRGARGRASAEAEAGVRQPDGHAVRAPPRRRAARTGLPQEEPPAAATACEAREKLDEAAFGRLHLEILAAGPECPPWKGRRILVVNGSKTALPSELAGSGFRVPDGAHCPQGMAGVPCRLRDRVPVDFDLFDHGNEREDARAHLARAAPGDVIVHDRGCLPFAKAPARLERGLDFVQWHFLNVSVSFP